MRGLLLGCAAGLLLATTPENATTDNNTAPEALTIQGAGPSITLVAELAQAFEQSTGTQVQVDGAASADGPAASLENGVQIGFVSRELTQAERDAGFSGFAFAFESAQVIVNADNATNDFTADQVRDFFTGTTTEWSDGQPVALFTQPANAPASQTFQQALLNDASFSADARELPEFALTQRVAETPGAIGFVNAPAATDAEGFQFATIGTLEPTTESVQSGSYPVARPVTFVTSGEPSEAAQAFIQFTLSAEGQQIVRDAGLFPAGSPAEQPVQTTASVETDTQE